MGSTKHLIIPDGHAKPGHHNKRFEWLGKLIADVKPDVVINIGDGADMESLCTYDKGKKDFQGRTYKADIESFIDSQDRLWSPVKARKKKLPLRVYLIGNHEQRIERALSIQPELEGVISYDDLQLKDYYDVVVPYNGSSPGTIDIDGILYAHYLVSGVMAKPISGEHHAYSLLSKHHQSCTVGHSHTLDFSVRSRGDGRKIHGLVTGCYQDYSPNYAGEGSKLWSSGVSICDNVDNGTYDWQWISLNTLKKTYG